jgi:hypothetical protein
MSDVDSDPEAGDADRCRGRIEDVLHYGFDPCCPCAGLPTPVAAAVESAGHRRGAASAADGTPVERTRSAFRAAVDACLEDGDRPRYHLVPLSAGLDSRAILGALLEHPDVARSGIRTVTFGTPGTWDFDIGREVARAAGIPNRSVDLRPDSFDWSLEALRRYARGRRAPIRMFEGYANARATALALADVDGECDVWSGFLGGTTTGQHVGAQPLPSWAAAVDAFAEAGRYTTSLTGPGHDPRARLPDEPYVPQAALPFRNQLSFAHRQQCYIRPVVVGDGQSRRRPFARPEWLRVALNLPREHRAHRRLFVDAMREAYPALFGHPTDANAGFSLAVSPIRRKLRRGRLRVTARLARTAGVEYTHPDTNYVDFERGFRTEGALRRTASRLLDGLDARDLPPALSPGAVWADHQGGTDRSAAIKVLCSLELYLRHGAGPTTGD